MMSSYPKNATVAESGVTSDQLITVINKWEKLSFRNRKEIRMVVKAVKIFIWVGRRGQEEG